MQRDVMREIRATTFLAQRDWRPSVQRRPRPFWPQCLECPSGQTPMPPHINSSKTPIPPSSKSEPDTYAAYD